MIDSEVYLEGKQAQINKWIAQVARLDTLCLEAGEDVRTKFEFQIKVFGHNLKELNSMFREFKGLNEYGRETFRQLIEKNWGELEESYNSSISEYEHLIRARIEE